MIRIAALACLIVIAAVDSKPVMAHPHVWADVKVQVLFDDEGRVQALHQYWLFDDYYSAFVISGADMNKDGKPDQAALEEVLAENMKNLKDYDYFSRAWSGDVRIETGEPSDLATGVSGNRLQMSFVLPLAEPVTANDLPFRYAIFDPTYYIEMVHAEAEDAVTLDAAPKNCKAEIRQPNPNPEQVALAASLDRTQSAGDTLGLFFAETVYVTCG
ncbi:MAG: DUF1007 family protein [Rhodospirillales bacterium]|nr:DUF1007 family protein [Rhodospirillales bacterium]